MQKLSPQEYRDRGKEIASICASGRFAKDAAKDFGLSVAFVYRACRAHGVKPAHPPRYEKIAPEQWATVDWSRGNREIALQFGVTPERVRQERLKKGSIQPKYPGLSVRGLRLRQWLYDNRSEVENMTVAQIRAACGTGSTDCAIRRALLDVGVACRERVLISETVTRENAMNFVAVLPENGCWKWTGTRKGYGYTAVGTGYGHRFFYELFNGPIPEGLWCLHKCDNPECVNPDHLYAGSPADNARDREERGRRKPPTAPIDVAEIRKRFKEGESLYSLAVRFDRSARTIRKIVSRRCHRAIA